MAITPEQKTEWIKALRSGKYLQGSGSLRTKDNKFCCLGVLADVLNPKGWNKLGCWRYHDKAAPDVSGAVHLSSSILSSPLQGELQSMNDGLWHRRHSFQEIADFLEITLETKEEG